MYWGQLNDVGDSFGHFGHKHPLSFQISVGHQYSSDVINILEFSPISSRQYHDVTNITVTDQMPTFLNIRFNN